jgi:5-methylcytosine-specific restriction endonuclease McrA
MCVFVVDSLGSPLMPCSERRARLMLRAKKADVFCKSPFTVRVLERVGGELQEIELKLDPGSKETGGAMAVKGEVRGWFIAMAFVILHKGHAVTKSLTSRASLRRGRRNRKTRYRKARFKNRRRKPGWLPPSLRSRVSNITALCKKLIRVCPITSIAVEQARFDLQKHVNPEISGAEYQQGVLFGYELREYLLEKWQRKCSYCEAKGVPLQIEHIHPRSKGGSESVTNLCLACEPCNKRKGAQPIEVFLKDILLPIQRGISSQGQ